VDKTVPGGRLVGEDGVMTEPVEEGHRSCADNLYLTTLGGQDDHWLVNNYMWRRVLIVL